MAASTDIGGGELLAAEAREEIGRLVSHPLEELKRLEHVAAEGESASTPLLLAIAVGGLLALVTGVVVALTLLVYYGA